MRQFFQRLCKRRALIGGLALIFAVIFAFGVCCFALSKTALSAQRPTVVLDAGHGGIDGGVVGITTGTKESDINLSIVFLLQEKFEDAGFRVVLTRKSEAGLYGAAVAGYKKRDMQKRAEIINESNPALVISVHQNFFSLKSRRGGQVFFREGLPSSVALAKSIQETLNSMKECVKKTQALKGDYFILNCSDYPSVIVECGFLSNPEDEALLITKEYQGKIASAIVSGALRFLAAPSSGR